MSRKVKQDLCLAFCLGRRAETVGSGSPFRCIFYALCLCSSYFDYLCQNKNYAYVAKLNSLFILIICIFGFTLMVLQPIMRMHLFILITKC